MTTTPIRLEIQDGCIVEFRFQQPLSMRLSLPRPPGFDFDIGTIVYADVSDYSGAYEADALFHEQVFATKNKRMLDDFTIHAINYTEAPNEYGTTVTIGG